MPGLIVSDIILILNSITIRELLLHCPYLGDQLWSGNFWTNVYYPPPVCSYVDKDIIQYYVGNQVNTYAKIHKDQLSLFDYFRCPRVCFGGIYRFTATGALVHFGTCYSISGA